LLAAALVVAGIFAFRRFGSWWSAASILVGMVWMILDVVRFWPRIVWDPDPFAAILIVPIGILAVEATARPPGFMLRLGLVRREYEQWQFDNELVREMRRIDQTLAAYPVDPTETTYQAWKATVSTVSDSALDAMSKLVPPDVEWGRLRDDYVGLYRAIVGRVQRGEPPDDDAATPEGWRLKEQADQLRREYRGLTRSTKRPER
jgi:hypothetical protein